MSLSEVELLSVRFACIAERKEGRPDQLFIDGNHSIINPEGGKRRHDDGGPTRPLEEVTNTPHFLIQPATRTSWHCIRITTFKFVMVVGFRAAEGDFGPRCKKSRRAPI